MAAKEVYIDPVRYEMFRHRLYNILEEGRIAITRVAGSPVVAEGGECMCSFYDAQGNTILTAAGLLFHCLGCRDAILKTQEWYEEEPGIYEGDQFFFNDPYIAATHVYDQIVVKPIFYQGRRIAWTGSMMHTSDTGGLLRGAATEIFHEGIRIQGLKLVDRGRFRPDVFRSITQQCRDPDYVGLDLKAKIAANNVCSKRFLELVDKYGVDLVEAACQKIMLDSEKVARARLRSLPDGTWRSRLYRFTYPKGERMPVPFRVLCTMGKQGEEITFDFTGSSPQNPDEFNSTLACSWSMLFVALSSSLFWDVPWNGGMIAPVRLVIPEGSILNCRFPAACGRGTGTGGMLTRAALECIAKMLYAGSLHRDVNAGPGDGYGITGPGMWYGGHNQHGDPVGQGVYDTFGTGIGAASYRDGVHTGGAIQNIQSCISDIEHTEMNYPFLYLGRSQMVDSGGYGKFIGGMGPERLMMVYRSQDVSVDYRGPAGEIPVSWGLFGGYPPFMHESVLLQTRDMPAHLARSQYPATCGEVGSEWGSKFKAESPGRVPVQEYDILAYQMDAGGGYGDPLDREPERVQEDVRNAVISLQAAERIFGVLLHAETLELDLAGTKRKRKEIRAERLREGKKTASLLRDRKVALAPGKGSHH